MGRVCSLLLVSSSDDPLFPRQIGLGAGLSADNVHSPTEIILAKSQGYNGTHTIQCEDITASGNTCFFTVRRTSLDDPAEYIDLLSSGHGTFGALGNGTWWQISPGCVRVKSISGLSECESAVPSPSEG